MEAPNWRILYKEILCTPDLYPSDDLDFLIRATEDAIFRRLQELSESADCTAERKDIDAAIHTIRGLQVEVLHFPAWKVLS